MLGMKKRPAHEVLGLPIDALMADITNAYKKMAQLYHPDKVSHLAIEFRNLAEARMIEINAAYEEMKNPNYRLLARASNYSPVVPSRPDTPISFLSFAGVNYGDTMKKAHGIFGKPAEIEDKPEWEFIYQKYFWSEDELTFGAELTYYKKTGVITDITINSLDAINKLRAKGVYGNNFSYLRCHMDDIKRRLGPPDTASVCHVGYHFPVPNKSGDSEQAYVSFVCYETDNYLCSSISVLWPVY
jgi:DnaJ domain